MASATHAHSDPKDPTDQSALPVQLDQKEPQAKAVCQAQMANLAQLVTRRPVPMAKWEAQAPKVIAELTEAKENQVQQAVKAQPEVQDQQDQRDQPVKKAKTVDQARPEVQDPMLKTVISVDVDQPAQRANQEHQAKTPPIALAHDALNHHKTSIMNQRTIPICLPAIFFFAIVDYKNVVVSTLRKQIMF